MLCPKCAGRMETVPTADHRVDRCTVCKGVWLDLGETRASPAAVAAIDDGAPRPVLAARRDIHCPRCRTATAAVTDPATGVSYEKCKVCQGVFLDAGEWRKLNPLTLAQWLRDRFSR
jgi:Zn-finger nucleic acid-binding protein